MENTVSGYPYDPVKGASSAFAILFTVSGVLHIFQNSKYKTWGILWSLPCTCIIFAAGFICCEYNAFHPGAFAPSQGLLFSGVPILMACLYLCVFSLIVTQRHPSKLWVGMACGVIVLHMCVIISLTAQGTANFFNPTASPDTIRSNLDILKATLILLLFSNISFLGILGLYHRRFSTTKVFDESANRKVKIVVFTLYALGLLILVRNIFRTIQIFSPSDSPAWSTEAFFWVFDASPLLICTLLLNALHPGNLIPVGEGNTHCSG